VSAWEGHRCRSWNPDISKLLLYRGQGEVNWVREGRARVALRLKEVILEGCHLLWVMKKEFYRCRKKGRGFQEWD
jgi:hypothetical protein